MTQDDLWREAMRLMDEAQRLCTCDDEKRAVLEHHMRQTPAALPAFIAAMRRELEVRS
jgi:hypothetical protein